MIALFLCLSFLTDMTGVGNTVSLIVCLLIAFIFVVALKSIQKIVRAFHNHKEKKKCFKEVCR